MVAENSGGAKSFIGYKNKYLKLIYFHSDIICVGKEKRNNIMICID